MRFSLAVLLLVPACMLAQGQAAPPAAGPPPSYANSDPNYRALRDGNLAESYTAENIVLQRDAATLTLEIR